MGKKGKRKDALLSGESGKTLCNDAYFISPDGAVIPVPGRHIDLIDANPELFGLTEKYLRRIYGRHGEGRGSEGCARGEFLDRIKDGGWIRVRIAQDARTGRFLVSFDLDRYDRAARQRIAAFLRGMKEGRIQSARFIIAKPDFKIWNESIGRIFRSGEGDDFRAEGS